MSTDMLRLLSTYGFFIIMLFITGIFCILKTRSLMRALIGLELLTKAVTLLLIVTGYVTGNVAFTQVLVITLIIIEVVVIAIMAGVILSAYRHTESLDVRALRDLKG
jgi:multisubunit Na+/H+ antiporter MnhC subunit